MKILYGGIGCNKSGEHTEEEFLSIMKNNFTTHNWSAELDVIHDLAHELEVVQQFGIKDTEGKIKMSLTNLILNYDIPKNVVKF